MKKLVFVGAMMLVAIGAMFSGCITDSIENGCRCTVKNTITGDSRTTTFTREEVKAADKYSCSAFARWAEDNDGAANVDWTCWGIYK